RPAGVIWVSTHFTAMFARKERDFSMRRISWIAVIAVALLVVTAPTALSQPVELRFMTCGGGLEHWTEAVAMWNERNPDVRVESHFTNGSWCQRRFQTDPPGGVWELTHPQVGS